MPKYLLFFTLLLPFWATSQEIGMKNYNTTHGLPSDEVYKSLIDTKGYIWFATNSGVCYFDGNRFHNLDMTDGLTENTILEISLDKQGRVWFAGISGDLCYYDQGKIYEYKGNAIIQQIKNQVELIASGCLRPIDTNEVSFVLNRGRMVHLKNDKIGIKDFIIGDTIYISSPDNKYKFYFTHNTEEANVDFIVEFDDRTIVTYKGKKSKYWSSFINQKLYVELDDCIIYFSRGEVIKLCKNGRVEHLNFDYIPIFASKGEDGGIWLATVFNGLMFFKDGDLNKEPDLHLLKDQNVSSILFDQNKTAWITTLSGGVFHIQSFYVTNYFQHANEVSNKIFKLLEIKNGRVLAFSYLSNVMIFDDFADKPRVISIPEIANQTIYHVELYNDKVYVATTSNVLVIPIAYFNKGEVNIKIDVIRKGNVKNFAIQDSVIWMATSTGIMMMPDYLKNGSKTIDRYSEKDEKRTSKVIKYHPSVRNENNSYLLCQDVRGLNRITYLKKNATLDEWSELEPKGNVRITNGNDIIFIGDDILVASKGNGLIWIHNDSLFSFDEDDGILSNYINVLKYQSSNELILGTNKGVNLLKFHMKDGPKIDSSLVITTNDGLRGNDITDILSMQNHIAVSSNKGVSLINVPEVIKRKDGYPIYIESFKVNGKLVKEFQFKDLQLKHNQNNIEISFDAVDLHDKQNIKYYYRINKENKWHIINEPRVVFPMMQAGKYQFEVKAKNSYGIWSREVVGIDFYIALVYYKRPIFILCIVLLFIGLIYWFLRLHFAQRSKRLENQKALAEYHQQSLSRVLNPHFISNVFNALNSAIINRRRKEALDYIKNISLFINQVFNSSYESKIKVSQEVILLKNYLDIEQRRSLSNFKSLIKYDSQIEDFKIPSMMIQIFAENSVIHGFSDWKIRGGLISIVFKKEEEFVSCTITDNGMGRQLASELSKSESNKPRRHGLDIIKERIDLLNTHYNKVKIQIESIDFINRNGEAGGTKTKISFPIRFPEDN